MLGAELYAALMVAVLGLAGLLGLVTLSLVLQRGVLWWNRRVSRRVQAALAPPLYESLSAGEATPELRRRARRSRRSVIREMMVKLALNLRGEEAAKLSALATQLGVARAEMRRLRSWDPSKRAQAATNLGTLRVRAALPHLLGAVRDSDTTVRLAAMGALEDLVGKESLDSILPLLGDRDPRIVRRAQEILLKNGPHASAKIADFIRSEEDSSARRAALDVLSLVADASASPLLLQLVESSDPEVRVKATKAAAILGDPRFLGPFLRLMSDSRWEVRSQAAKGLGGLRRPDSIDLLRKALGDPHRWVRIHAAESLRNLGAEGRAVLEAACEGGCARARSAARYALEGAE